MVAFFWTMIYLTKNSTTTIYLEAQQLNTTGHYLFVIYGYDSGETVVAYLDQLEETERYVSFDINVPDDLDISTPGEYKYTVYNGDGNSEDYSTFTVLEVGRLILEE